MALHATAAEYHTSGAWVSLGVAAIGARLLGLDQAATREALGIAEYNGPRSQMMRCIDHPTMIKDGSGWGAMTGVVAACLAREGFTGAPAVTVEDESVAALWGDIGERWRIREQYFKAYPVCRWAQPAMEAAAQLRRDHEFRPRRDRSHHGQDIPRSEPARDPSTAQHRRSAVQPAVSGRGTARQRPGRS